MMDIGLGSSTGFEHVQTVLTNPIAKLILWLILAALWYHLIAGIRHLLMDIGIGESLRNARLSGVLTISISMIAAILIGVWLW